MKRLMSLVYIVFGLYFCGLFIYKIFHRALTDYFLNKNAIITKAVIIDEKNYLPNSFVTFPFSYSYKFIKNGKFYKNDSHDTTLKAGDTVEVEYYNSWPRFNKALHSKN